MSVKSDRWIRRMSLEHKMIEPFVDRQLPAKVAYAKQAGIAEVGVISNGSLLSEDVARAVVALSSGQTRWVTGNVLGVDGGEDLVDKIKVALKL